MIPGMVHIKIIHRRQVDGGGRAPPHFFRRPPTFIQN